MKINIVIADGLTGRAARLYGAPLAHHLARRGCEVRLILLHRRWDETEAKRFEAEPGVTIVYVQQAFERLSGRSLLRRGVTVTRAMLRAILEYETDVNVICEMHPTVVAAARIARFLRGTPMVLAAEQLLSESANCRAKKTCGFFERVGARLSAAIAANNRQLADRLSEMSRGRNRAVFVPPAIEPSLYRTGGLGAEALRELLEIEDRPVAACVGETGEPEARALMDIFAAVVRRIPAAILLLADGGESGLRAEYARRIGVADNVRFARPISAANFGRYISLADVVVDPTGDAAGRVLPGMFFGRPVLAAGGSDIAWLLGEGGITVRPDATSDFEQALYLMLVDRRLRLKMGRRGAQRVRRHFLWENLAERWVDLISGVAAGSSAAVKREAERVRREEGVLS